MKKKQAHPVVGLLDEFRAVPSPSGQEAVLAELLRRETLNTANEFTG